MVVHTGNPRLWTLKQEDHKFEPNLGNLEILETLSQNKNEKSWGYSPQPWVQSSVQEGGGGKSRMDPEDEIVSDEWTGFAQVAATAPDYVLRKFKAVNLAGTKSS